MAGSDVCRSEFKGGFHWAFGTPIVFLSHFLIFAQTVKLQEVFQRTLEAETSDVSRSSMHALLRSLFLYVMNPLEAPLVDFNPVSHSATGLNSGVETSSIHFSLVL